MSDSTIASCASSSARSSGVGISALATSLRREASIWMSARTTAAMPHKTKISNVVIGSLVAVEPPFAVPRLITAIDALRLVLLREEHAQQPDRDQRTESESAHDLVGAAGRWSGRVVALVSRLRPLLAGPWVHVVFGGPVVVAGPVGGSPLVLRNVGSVLIGMRSHMHRARLGERRRGQQTNRNHQADNSSHRHSGEPRDLGATKHPLFTPRLATEPASTPHPFRWVPRSCPDGGAYTSHQRSRAAVRKSRPLRAASPPGAPGAGSASVSAEKRVPGQCGLTAYGPLFSPDADWDHPSDRSGFIPIGWEKSSRDVDVRKKAVNLSDVLSRSVSKIIISKQCWIYGHASSRREVVARRRRVS